MLRPQMGTDKVRKVKIRGQEGANRDFAQKKKKTPNVAQASYNGEHNCSPPCLPREQWLTDSPASLKGALARSVHKSPADSQHPV